MLQMCYNVINVLTQPFGFVVYAIIQTLVTSLAGRSEEVDNLSHSSQPEAESTPKLPQVSQTGQA